MTFGRCPWPNPVAAAWCFVDSAPGEGRYPADTGLNHSASTVDVRKIGAIGRQTLFCRCGVQRFEQTPMSTDPGHYVVYAFQRAPCAVLFLSFFLTVQPALAERRVEVGVRANALYAPGSRVSDMRGIGLTSSMLLRKGWFVLGATSRPPHLC